MLHHLAPSAVAGAKTRPAAAAKPDRGKKTRAERDAAAAAAPNSRRGQNCPAAVAAGQWGRPPRGAFVPRGFAARVLFGWASQVGPFLASDIPSLAAAVQAGIFMFGFSFASHKNG